MTHILAIAASKGGVGKTTIAASLAAHLAERHTAAVADLDSQLSLSRWIDRRITTTSDDSWPALIRGTDVATIVKEAKRAEADVLVLDCPPGSIATTEKAVAVAHSVLVPVRPSPLDIEAISPIVELCRAHKTPFAFVLNAAQSNTAAAKMLAAGSRDFLSPLGKVVAPVLTLRPSYATAMLDGHSASETDATAKAEIAALWRATASQPATPSWTASSAHSSSPPSPSAASSVRR